jgi:hypothetical protein
MSSPKNQTSNIKKNNNFFLNNRPIYEDPRYKEFEGISLDKFKAEKEKSQREYIQLQKELEILKEEYEKTKIRTKDRENELRGHINNLLIKYRTKDPELNIKNINELSGQILSNIKKLEEQTKIDIKEKKKDMETRIKLRLVDSEINYNKELEKKVKEQQEILKSLHEFTQDMKRIKDNYNSIKEKADNFLKENDYYRNEIKKYEEKNEELKNEIMKLKHENNKMNIKLMGKNQKKLEENDEEDKLWEEGDNINTNNLINEGIYGYNANNEEFDNLKKVMKNKLEKENIQKFNKKMKLKAETFTIKDFKATNNIKYDNITIEKIIDLLSDENYVNKHYRQCSVIASLLNIYEKANKKITNLNREYNKLLDHHPIYDRLITLIQELKSKEINNRIKTVSKLSRRVVNEILGNYIITMKKDQRKELIKIITEDEQIINFIQQDKMPNIMNRDRQIKIA